MSKWKEDRDLRDHLNRVHYQFVNCYPRLFGVRFQVSANSFLTPDTRHLKPHCKAFAQEMNKLMCEKHFNKSVMLPLNNIIESIEDIWSFTEGMSIEDLESDKKTLYAVIRCLEITGEAVKKIP
ncbi:MAG: hypothetical protein SRB2_02424 [Desulfobacteraceae bacterium Eth-SRB2]|nr:MAG: hypothetical protein SRB2_02424 [Desulfobacteraceae bacterium Eth-SRB2]